jgi:pimeloyl-ACP methyl ester carboxylesterase
LLRRNGKPGGLLARPFWQRIALSATAEPNAATVAGSTATAGIPPINLPFPTMGGRQIWADQFMRHGWRIQRNVFTDHFRLLDPNNIRRAWGSYEHCRARFDEHFRRAKTPAPNEHIVMLVHGLGRSSSAFAALEDAIRQAGHATANINYPSTRQGIAAHADDVGRIIESFEGVESISFVTHSLGALVVRDLLARDGAWQDRIDVRRIVMIAPPNQGSQLAKRLAAIPAYHWLTGESGQDLASEVARSLPVPDAEIGIIAGGRGNRQGFNPMLTGDDDGFVAVSETHLDGMDDFLLVNTTHGLIDDHPLTIAATIAFLNDGHFCRDMPEQRRRRGEAGDERAAQHV